MNILSALFYFAAALAACVSVAATFRARKAPARRTFSIVVLLLAVQSALAGLINSAPSAGAVADWRSWWLVPHALASPAWLLFVLKYSRGNSRISIRKWASVLAALTLLPLASLTLYYDSILLPTQETEADPRNFQIGFGGFLIYLCKTAAAALILIHLERTFRAAVGTMRWRIKYVILGTGTYFVADLYTSSQVLLFRTYPFSFDIITSTALLLAALLFLVGLLRTGLFRVQVYPSEQVLQFSIAGVLIGAYLLLIGVLNKLFAAWQGPDAFALKAFVLLSSLALLAILLVSERSRDRLRRWISRHFHRPFFDYRAVWLSLTQKTANVHDRDALCHTVATWISEQLRVLSTSIWLVEPDTKSIHLAASTGLAATGQQFSGNIADELIGGLQNTDAPFDIDKSSARWAQHLRSCFPDNFPDAGNRVCVPLNAAGRLIGFCTIGDRVNYISLELQELELLKCIGDQVASNLLNLELSTRLLQAKEMEAFQTIAAFFVHDLKNTASTLNLTLQNLPKHFDNPEFRKDALRAIGSSVNHIQDLIGRLTLFRQQLELKRAPTDLNECVRAALATLKQSSAPIRTELATIPPVFADADQLQKVITNLVLNGLEALRGTGEVSISTAQQNGHITLVVTDNGAGMTPEFIATGLFRPFKTTKKGGIGIGMFQTKTIIDAHGGRIQVQSTPAQGTTFTISLPQAPST